MTHRCESCGNTPAVERFLESCETPESSGYVEKVCIMHNLCDDCYHRYNEMTEPNRALFRDHLIEEGSGVVLEL